MKDPIGIATLAAFLSCLIPAPSSAQDCNGNFMDDAGDIRNGFSKDCNHNSIPDECDLLPTLSSTPLQTIIAARRPEAIVAMDLDLDGDPDLVTANMHSGNLSILRNDGPHGFALAGQEGVGSEPLSLAAGDFDRDLRLDLAVANHGSGTLSILRGGGDGRLEPAAELDAGMRPIAVVSARLDGDEFPDLAAALFETRALRVWRNRGDGTFHEGQDIALGLYPGTLVAVDFDADGLVDLATTAYFDPPIGERIQELRLYRNQGDARFAPSESHPLSGVADSLAAGDFDGDGSTDFAVQYGALQMLWRQPGGGLESQSLPFATRYYRVIPADFDLDGATDIVLSGDGLLVLRNAGARVLDPAQSFSSVRGMNAVAALDLNGDGRVDLAAANTGGCCTWGGTSAWIVAQGEDGGLALAERHRLDEDPRGISSGDIDGDGLRDLVVTSAGGLVSALPNRPSGVFRRAATFHAGGKTESIAAADLDGDSRAEIIAALYEEDAVSVFRASADGSFEPWRSTSLPGFHPMRISAADIDGDGDNDLIVMHDWQSILFLRNDGEAGFVEANRIVDIPALIYTATPIELNGDGRVDFITSSNGDTLAYLGLGGFSFEALYLHFLAPPGLATETGDFDGDGRLDLVAGRETTGIVIRGLSASQFSKRSSTYWHQRGSWWPTVGDLDGDGSPEIAFAGDEPMPGVGFLKRSSPAAALDLDGNGSPDDCDLTLNDCNANGIHDRDEVLSGQAPDCNLNGVPDECDLEPALALAPPLSFAVGENPYSLLAADLDGDADIDVATAHTSSNDVSVLINDSELTFLPEARYPVVVQVPNESTGSSPAAIIAADLDMDGDLDLATKNGRYSSGSLDTTITLLWNQGNATFILDPGFLITPGGHTLAAADLSGDGRPDLVSAGSEAADYFASASQGFEPRRTLALPFETHARYVGCTDADGDADPDIVAAGSRLVVLRNEGGSFDTASDLPLDEPAESGALGDLDLDGDPDAVLPRYFAGKTSVHLNEGAGVYGPGATELPTPRALDAAAVDLDGDADLEIVTAQPDVSLATVWTNGGSAAFGPAREFTVGRIPLAVTAADVDGNGTQDPLLAIGEHSTGEDFVQVLLNYSTWSRDCDGNGVPDDCDIAVGLLVDGNGDGIADVCLQQLAFTDRPQPPRNPKFHRGDPNDDARADMSDAIATLHYLFVSGLALACLDAADFDNNGNLDISDPIAQLNHLFLGGPGPAPPGAPDEPCGEDPDAAGTPAHLGCALYRGC